jgi:hypothetical protein
VRLSLIEKEEVTPLFSTKLNLLDGHGDLCSGPKP